MNRRRRSHQQRRTELEVRHQPDATAASMQNRPLPPQQHPMPAGFTHLQSHFFAQPIYHSGPGAMPQQMRLPSNGPPFRAHGMIETPLPSPSAYSQLSTDGAPSLVSDTSSMSARSPNNGGSPIELPPLSGARSERRQSAAPMLQLGVPGSFVQEHDFQMPMHRFGDEVKHTPRMLQEPFMPVQTFPHPSQYLPSQPRNPSPLQASAPHVYAVPNPLHSRVIPHLHHQQAMATTHFMQLPSISNMGAPARELQGFTSSHVDPSLSQVRCTPVPSAPTPDGSPKDKMSLSNLTL
jgi:Myb-like DNA-binding protein FlbD